MKRDLVLLVFACLLGCGRTAWGELAQGQESRSRDPECAAILAAEVPDQVRHLIAQQLGVEESRVVPDAQLLGDLGADPLDMSELIMALEESFGIDIPDDAEQNMRTVQDAIDAVRSEAQQSRCGPSGGRRG